jgi:hypothetical protein
MHFLAWIQLYVRRLVANLAAEDTCGLARIRMVTEGESTYLF